MTTLNTNLAGGESDLASLTPKIQPQIFSKEKKQIIQRTNLHTIIITSLINTDVMSKDDSNGGRERET